MPLVACLAVLSAFPDWVLQKVDSGAEWVMCVLLGGKCARLRDPYGRPTGQECLYSIVGALDPTYVLPDERLLCVPTNDKEKELAFPSPAAAGWGNATFLALCMKLAYEDWLVVRDVINHEWRHRSLYSDVPREAGEKRFLAPRFIQGCSFNFMQPAGSESSEELAQIHLDSDAVLLAVEDPARPSTPEAAASGAFGSGVAVVLAFRGTEPLELADFQSDFDAVPEAGEWGCLHPGFLLALGVDPNLNPYHQTLTTFTTLEKEAPATTVVSAKPVTPYEVLRDLILDYMEAQPTAKLYVCGHSLGGALAVVFMGALMHDSSKRVEAIKSRVGALYTFGQPRVGDYEFLCHLQVSLLEPSRKPADAAAAAAPHKPAAGGGDDGGSGHAGTGGHHTEHAMSAAGASKLRSLLKGHQEQDTAPPLTSRYIRVVNTFDIVPHIPPTLCNLYQHGGDLLYLQPTPGDIKFLTEQPMFFITGIWTSSLVKLYHYTAVLLGFRQWKGRDNYIRYGMRIGAVVLPFLMGGLNDHMPGDYCQSIINSLPAAWQPFKPRKRLSRWANAVMFARALQAPGRALPTANSAKTATAAAAAPPAAKKSSSITARIQAQVVALTDKAASLLLPPEDANKLNGTNSSNGTYGSGAAAVRGVKASSPSGSSSISSTEQGAGMGKADVPDTAAASDDSHSKTAAAKAKIKGLTQRAVAHANAK